MATFTITIAVGGISASATVSPSNARVTKFLDDMIENYPEVDDGSGGTRLMTRAEVADYYVDKLLGGQVEWAKGLERRRLAAGVDSATDLEGN